MFLLQVTDLKELQFLLKAVEFHNLTSVTELVPRVVYEAEDIGEIVRVSKTEEVPVAEETYESSHTSEDQLWEEFLQEASKVSGTTIGGLRNYAESWDLIKDYKGIASSADVPNDIRYVAAKYID